MSNMPANQSGLTFQEIAARLPADKLNRLAEITKAYPDIRLEQLPDSVKQEMRSILQMGIDTARAQTKGGHAGQEYSLPFNTAVYFL
jgi:hypothetical protein